MSGNTILAEKAAVNPFWLSPNDAANDNQAPDWSPQQDAALKAVDNWLDSPENKQWFYLAGFAGTGKTTLARHFANNVNGKVLFAAYTGKAALVMRSKGCAGASTIHSLIYNPIELEDGSVTFELNEKSDAAGADLIIIDEVSMVGKSLATDLLSYGKPVLVIGDPAQLPPVNDGGYFTNGEPDAMLTEIHRQAKDDPIIGLSMQVREGKLLQVGIYGESMVWPKYRLTEQDAAGRQILVGMNKTRQQANAAHRERTGFKGVVPNEGERLICLRNNRRKGLFNGQLLTVEEASRLEVTSDMKPREVELTLNTVKLHLRDDDGQLIKTEAHLADFATGGNAHTKVNPKALNDFDRFDFGYALTVHKSQGSQWDSVFLYDESFVFGKDKWRWLYTGITRAANRVTVAV